MWKLMWKKCKKKKMFSFLFVNGTLNNFNKNSIKYKKDIAKHVCYCFPRLNI